MKYAPDVQQAPRGEGRLLRGLLGNLKPDRRGDGGAAFPR